MRDFDTLLQRVKDQPVRKIAVAVGQDAAVIGAAVRARDEQLADVVLVGDEEKIRSIAGEMKVCLDGVEIHHQSEPLDAVTDAVRMVSSGQADILMKGYVHTDDFLRGVLNKEYGLRTGSIMSHVFVVEMKEAQKLLFITDAAMNIAPDLEQKAAILLNAVHLANLFGLDRPKVAVMAAVELINPAMQATLDAGSLEQMATRNQYVPQCIVDGPFALDNAVCSQAAEHKKIGGPVAGQADILVMPNIEAGNMLAKSMVYFGGKRMIGLLIGARAPVVLTSRADSMECKLLSMAGAVLMVNMKRELKLKIGKVHY